MNTIKIMNQEELGNRNQEDENDQNCELGGTKSQKLKKDEHDQDREARGTIWNKELGGRGGRT